VGTGIVDGEVADLDVKDGDSLASHGHSAPLANPQISLAKNSGEAIFIDALWQWCSGLGLRGFRPADLLADLASDE
jgi:hypothetical protein